MLLSLSGYIGPPGDILDPMHRIFHCPGAALRVLSFVACAVLAGCIHPPEPGMLTFAVWGDTPYTRYEREVALDMLAEQAARPLAFSLHVGDLKGGSTPCDDAVFADRRRLLERSAHPLVLLAGDNDWLDCRRAAAGGFDPFERLTHLRGAMFGDGRLDGALRPAVLPGVPEHRRWRMQGLVFVTLNVPGGNLPDDPRSDALRTAARDWLDAAFDEAERTAAPAIVIAFHASPDFAAGDRSPRYGWLLGRIAARAASASRPVLLVHGDTHLHRADHPLRHPDDGTVLSHVMRIESHGTPWLGWAEVELRPGQAAPFRVTPHPYRRD